MRLISAFLSAFALLALTAAASAKPTTIVGVITAYESGNEGTDMTVRTSDGHVHDLWFDNMKKPTFRGKSLPWCPEFPCDGWPAQIVLGKTRVSVSVVTERVEGKTIVTPLTVDLAK